ncbi:Eukaryotic translation initiation factor 4B [Coemansia sp. RSA 1804]|nr:Eukaryotic translation initiation factor 4B [Coemansia sp. RSA 1804]
MPAKKKSGKGVKMSLNDFLSDAPSSMSWADEEVVLPSAPMGESNSSGGMMMSVDDAPDRKEYMAMRREQELRGSSSGRYAARREVPFPTEPPFTAFVGNLPLDTDETLVREVFGAGAAEGGVKTVRLIQNRETGRLKGFGYVEFETADALRAAVAKDGVELGGRPLRIDVSEARDSHDQQRPDDPLAGTTNWRRANDAGPIESAQPASPFASRSSSGFGRSASGFGRSPSGFGRAPREPAPPTVADENIDWRAHKNPPPGTASPGAEGSAPRRTMFADRFSRSSSGAGEARDEPKNWRSENAREPRRRSRDRSASREPRVLSAVDQEPSWRAARTQKPQDPAPKDDGAGSDQPAPADGSEPKEGGDVKQEKEQEQQEQQQTPSKADDGWSQVEKPAGRRPAAPNAGGIGARRDRGSNDLRSPPRSAERRNGGSSFFARQQQQQQARDGTADDSDSWRRA